LEEPEPHQRPDGVDAEETTGEHGKGEDFDGEDGTDGPGEIEECQENVDGVSDVLAPETELAVPGSADVEGTGPHAQKGWPAVWWTTGRRAFEGRRGGGIRLGSGGQRPHFRRERRFGCAKSGGKLTGAAVTLNPNGP